MSIDEAGHRSGLDSSHHRKSVTENLLLIEERERATPQLVMGAW